MRERERVKEREGERCSQGRIELMSLLRNYLEKRTEKGFNLCEAAARSDADNVRCDLRCIHLTSI